MSLIAGISKSQIGELERHLIASTTALAILPLPLQWRPDRGAAKSFEKIREQARIQVEGRTSGTIVYGTLTPIVWLGPLLGPLLGPIKMLASDSRMFFRHLR